MPLAIPILDKVLLDFVNASLLDNLCDRAHYVFTTVLLFYFSILIAGKQMFGEPIRCMTPAEYSGRPFIRVHRRFELVASCISNSPSSGDWAKYVNEFCFSTSTFVNSIGGYDKSVPGGVININYYQVCSILLLSVQMGIDVARLWLSVGAVLLPRAGHAVLPPALDMDPLPTERRYAFDS